MNNNREVEKELGGAEVFKEVGRRYRLNMQDTHWDCQVTSKRIEIKKNIIQLRKDWRNKIQAAEKKVRGTEKIQGRWDIDYIEMVRVLHDLGFILI